MKYNVKYTTIGYKQENVTNFELGNNYKSKRREPSYFKNWILKYKN